ncbi:methyltransferase domain-containing protein [Dyella sp. 333MFSha]|uniref:methyltransferase domain-containing protein n=1 Tax=Dyella sp. 333MFSha TaxID=1798240 RepID=UPI00088AA985|nr:methyltransferase domain-containing protein [Dyella sp. 333MFSha]SDG47317.1 Glycosyltransferase involved in cell wall bisynthesis [Dyella sp. 333MFSha]
MDTYDNAFAPTNLYGHVVELLSRFQISPGSFVVDVGCGYGRIAEVLRDRFDVSYIGLDADLDALASLRERGFSVVQTTAGQDDVQERITSALPADAVIGAVIALDFLEHLLDPAAMLQSLSAVARPFNAPLVVSIPNTAHRDVGVKLALGHFDYTQSGLLDRTHIQFFTGRRVEQMMQRHGWHEVHRHDFIMRESDQHFPQALPGVAQGTPLGDFFSTLRDRADEFGYTNQFVRAYLPGPLARAESVAVKSPFLSVVIRTTGTRVGTLREGLLCLSAQSDDDFEVVIVGHNLKVDAQTNIERLIEQLHESFRRRVRLVLVQGGGRAVPLNTGFREALGEYVAAFDDDDLLFGGWVQNFKDLAAKSPGTLLRQGTVAQDWDRIHSRGGALTARAMGGMRSIYPKTFDYIAHLVENRTPLHSIAFPRALFSHMGFEFDEGHSTVEDWDLIVRTAPLCGVSCTPEIGCIYRHWVGGDSSYTAHSQFEWSSNYVKTLKKLNDEPLLLPRGSTERLRKMYVELDRLRGGVDVETESQLLVVAPEVDDGARLDALRDRYHELVTSKSWQITGSARALARILRRRPWVREPKVWLMSESQLDTQIRLILHSPWWRWTRILRGVRR